MTKTQKLLLAVYCACVAICLFAFIKVGNWCALIWCITSICLLISHTRLFQNSQKHINDLKEAIRRKNGIITKMYGKDETMTANCSRYLKEITELKKKLNDYEATYGRQD
jgi:hypothetical protein